MAKKQKPETIEQKPETIEDLGAAIHARAMDNATLTHWNSPGDARAVRGALLHLADIISGKNELVHVPEPVKKRRLD